MATFFTIRISGLEIGKPATQVLEASSQACVEPQATESGSAHVPFRHILPSAHVRVRLHEFSLTHFLLSQP